VAIDPRTAPARRVDTWRNRVAKPAAPVR